MAGAKIRQYIHVLSNFGSQATTTYTINIKKHCYTRTSWHTAYMHTNVCFLYILQPAPEVVVLLQSHSWKSTYALGLVKC